jgi:hypothetical protein
MDIYFIKSLKKENSILTSIILFTLAFLSIEFLQIENNNVLAQSVEVIDTTSRNNVPSTDIFNLITGYTIEPIVWNLTAPDSLTFDKDGNMYIGEAG